MVRQWYLLQAVPRFIGTVALCCKGGWQVPTSQRSQETPERTGVWQSVGSPGGVPRDLTHTCYFCSHSWPYAFAHDSELASSPGHVFGPVACQNAAIVHSKFFQSARDTRWQGTLLFRISPQIAYLPCLPHELRRQAEAASLVSWLVYWLASVGQLHSVAYISPVHKLVKLWKQS